MLFTKHDVHAFNEIYQKKGKSFWIWTLREAAKKGGVRAWPRRKQNFFLKLEKISPKTGNHLKKEFFCFAASITRLLFPKYNLSMVGRGVFRIRGNQIRDFSSVPSPLPPRLQVVKKSYFAIFSLFLSFIISITKYLGVEHLPPNIWEGARVSIAPPPENAPDGWIYIYLGLWPLSPLRLISRKLSR